MVHFLIENMDHIASVACIAEVGFHVSAHSIHGYLVVHRKYVAPRLVLFFRGRTLH